MMKNMMNKEITIVNFMALISSNASTSPTTFELIRAMKLTMVISLFIMFLSLIHIFWINLLGLEEWYDWGTLAIQQEAQDGMGGIYHLKPGAESLTLTLQDDILTLQNIADKLGLSLIHISFPCSDSSEGVSLLSVLRVETSYSRQRSGADRYQPCLLYTSSSRFSR